MNGDALDVAQVEEVGVRSSQRSPKPPSRLGGKTVGQTDRATRPVVATRPKPAGVDARRLVDTLGLGQTELGEIERSVLFVHPHNTDEVVKYFGYPYDSESGWLVSLKQCPNLVCGGLSLEERQHGVGVKNDHRFRSRAASSLRA